MDAARTPVVLSIAGSDSGGGAGIQADLKAFAALGVYGTTAITAITAQNTVGVDRIGAVTPELIVAQVRAVVDDIVIDAVKVGMLGTPEATDAVVSAISLVGSVPIVVDPVMVSESGASLLTDDARAALIEALLPLASVVTPNLAEAEVLAGLENGASTVEMAAAIRALGPASVIVTGGHSDGADLLDDGSEPLWIPGPIHPDGAAHGSGCTHSSSLAALLALGYPLRDAAIEARKRAGDAVANGLRGVGHGAGPVDALAIAGRRPLPPLP